jgi:pilus assembly protein CpaB
MMRGRGPLLIIVSLLLAVGAAWVANNWVIARTAAPTAVKPGTVPVVTAAIDIPFGTKIEARHVRQIQMLAGTEPKGTFAAVTAAEGKVARASIIAGEILLAERFADAGQGSTLAAVVDKDMRAVTLRVDDVSGVAGFLLPGNRVDVVSAYKEDRETKSETVLQNVRVLAVDQTASTDKNEPVIVRAVTLEVSPKDAEVLIAAKQRGSISLTLRNPLDESVQAKAPPKAEIKPVVKVGPPPPAPTVTVIRGTDVDRKPLVKGAGS